MSTERRDHLVSALEAGKAVLYGKVSPEHGADAERQVDGVIAEALRNAAARLQAARNDPSTYYLEFLGLERAMNTLREDAAALENNTTERTED